ncbi:hypothetical protein Tco_0008419 [Tanacetum coccineum]
MITAMSLGLASSLAKMILDECLPQIADIALHSTSVQKECPCQGAIKIGACSQFSFECFKEFDTLFRKDTRKSLFQAYES